MELVGEFRETATRQVKATIDDLHLASSGHVGRASTANTSTHTHSTEEEMDQGEAERFLSMFTLDSICYEFAADYQGSRCARERAMRSGLMV
jgi:hypothetical protein